MRSSEGKAPNELEKLIVLLKQKDAQIHSLQEELSSTGLNKRKLNVSNTRKRRTKSGTDFTAQPQKPTIRLKNKSPETYEGLIANSMRNFEVSLNLINEATRNIKQTREAIQTAN